MDDVIDEPTAPRNPRFFSPQLMRPLRKFDLSHIKYVPVPLTPNKAEPDLNITLQVTSKTRTTKTNFT